MASLSAPLASVFSEKGSYIVSCFVEQIPPRLMIDILEKSGIGLALNALVGVLGIPGVIDASLLTLDRLNSLNLVD